MKFLKKNWGYLIEVVFLIFIFFAGQLPLRDYDIWFHLKSGELFVKQGHLQFTEVFSHTAQGREWIPYEWLFQVVVFLLSQISLKIIPIFMAIFVVITQFFFLRILDSIFGLKLFSRLVLAFTFFVSIYEFNTARPHVIAYGFVVITIFLILKRIYQEKRWIFFSPLLTLIWANLHSTAFLSWGLALAFAVIALILWFFEQSLKDKKRYLASSKDLLLVAVVNFLITIAPPLGTLDYKLLWTFFVNRDFLGIFIGEWAPTSSTLGYSPVAFISYSVLFLLSVVWFLVVTFKKKLWYQNLWAIPLIFMGIVGYTAVRNIFLGSFGLLVILAWNLKTIESLPKKTLYYLFVTLAILITGFNGYLLILKKMTFSDGRLYYPVQSTEFAKHYLSGKLFNDYTYGGYVLYSVYPHLQVFIDGRADVYICCQAMRDYLNLSLYKNWPDKEYKKFLDKFWQKYDVSVAILSSQKHNVLRRIAKLLSTDPNWALVFWDDDSQVFVRRNGKNDGIIKELEVKAATPYLRNPYLEGRREEALKEYKKMNKIAKTARTLNAIGFILMEKGDYDEASTFLLQALDQDPSFESPYMNLAELEAKDGKLANAITFYSKALKLAPDRGLIYIRLGQLILEATGDKDKVRKLWQKGVEKTVDEDAKAKLKELLSTL